METIQDYYQVNKHLATSGQPTPEQFGEIKKAGYEVVINLAMSRSTDALANEDTIVKDLGLVYVHLPVVWENPTLEDVKLFFVIMENFRDRRVWVHCAKNMRVSCFVYLWQKHILRLSDAEARQPMDLIWQPTGVWQQLIERVSSDF